jgi:putative transposase
LLAHYCWQLPERKGGLNICSSIMAPRTHLAGRRRSNPAIPGAREGHGPFRRPGVTSVWWCDRDAYLLALCRYVERNPLAAGLLRAASDWPWSSYRAHVGDATTPPWLDSDGLHAYLLDRPVGTARDRRLAVQRYAALVADAQPNEAPLWDGLRGQVFLGDEAFVARMPALAPPARRAAVDVPKAQRKSPLTLRDCLQQLPGKPAQALCRAYREGGITMTAIAKELKLSVSRVSRMIAAAELEIGATG